MRCFYYLMRSPRTRQTSTRPVTRSDAVHSDANLCAGCEESGWVKRYEPPRGGSGAMCQLPRIGGALFMRVWHSCRPNVLRSTIAFVMLHFSTSSKAEQSVVWVGWELTKPIYWRRHASRQAVKLCPIFICVLHNNEAVLEGSSVFNGILQLQTLTVVG